MDSVSTGVATAALTLLVLLAARRLGGSLAGLIAGLPYSTIPALVWISGDRGAAVGSQVAIGSVVGCAIVALFAAAYERAARRFSPAITLILSMLTLTAGVGLVDAGGSSLLQACVLAVVASAMAWASMRRPGEMTSSQAKPLPAKAQCWRPMAITVLSAGAVGSGVVTLAGHLRPEYAGLLTTIPIVGAATAMAEHATRGSVAVTRFLRAYVVSGLVEVGFSAVFALCVIPGGCSIFEALILALVASATICLVTSKGSGWFVAKSVLNPPPSSGCANGASAPLWPTAPVGCQLTGGFRACRLGISTDSFGSRSVR